MRPGRLPAIGPALTEARFLVDAVAFATPLSRVRRPAGRRRMVDDLAWTVDLFTVLELRERAQRPAR
jgi:hypothetical protein